MTNNFNDTNKTKHSRHRSLKERWNQTSLPNKLLIVFTAVIATANLIYAVFSLWQLSILRGQLAQMQEVSHLEQRAWVGVSNASYDAIEPNKPATGKFIFKNTGKTPATIITQGHTVCIRPADFDVEALAKTKKETTWKTEKPIQKCIAPNASMALNFSTSKEHPLSDEVVKSINSGELRLYVIGHIIYSDIFGFEHQTKFCGIAKPNTTEMNVHHKYNYMD